MIKALLRAEVLAGIALFFVLFIILSDGFQKAGIIYLAMAITALAAYKGII